jgi:hypothetical protein
MNLTVHANDFALEEALAHYIGENKSYVREQNRAWTWAPGDWRKWKRIQHDLEIDVLRVDEDRLSLTRNAVQVALQNLTHDLSVNTTSEAVAAITDSLSSCFEVYLLCGRLRDWTQHSPHEAARQQSLAKIRTLHLPTVALQHFVTVIEQLKFQPTDQPLVEALQIPDDEFVGEIDFQDPGVLKLIKLARAIRSDRQKLLDDRSRTAPDEEIREALEELEADVSEDTLTSKTKNYFTNT